MQLPLLAKVRRGSKSSAGKVNNMKVFLLFLCLCGSITFASSSSNSSRSSMSRNMEPYCNEYKFYCRGYVGTTVGSTCLSRTDLCTRDESESNKCLRKTYDHCNYISSKGKFKVLRYSTSLSSSSSSRRSFSDLFACLERKPEHPFIVYRGLMYEYGIYGTRIQDPNDPNYEYGPNGRSKSNEECVGESSCTYEQVLPYLEIWKSDEYRLCTHNCQDFAKGLATYLKDGCKMSSSDKEMAHYVFNIARDGKCTTTLSSAGSLHITAAFIAAIICGTFFILF